jgi:Flp pilus assembly pilin Flp
MNSFFSSPTALRRSRSRQGQTVVEYALILATLALVAFIAFTQLGRQVGIVFSAMDNLLDTAQSST